MSIWKICLILGYNFHLTFMNTRICVTQHRSLWHFQTATLIINSTFKFAYYTPPILYLLKPKYRLVKYQFDYNGRNRRTKLNHRTQLKEELNKTRKNTMASRYIYKKFWKSIQTTHNIVHNELQRHRVCKTNRCSV